MFMQKRSDNLSISRRRTYIRSLQFWTLSSTRCARSLSWSMLVRKVAVNTSASSTISRVSRNIAFSWVITSNSKSRSDVTIAHVPWPPLTLLSSPLSISRNDLIDQSFPSAPEREGARNQPHAPAPPSCFLRCNCLHLLSDFGTHIDGFTTQRVPIIVVLTKPAFNQFEQTWHIVANCHLNRRPNSKTQRKTLLFITTHVRYRSVCPP